MRKRFHRSPLNGTPGDKGACASLQLLPTLVLVMTFLPLWGCMVSRDRVELGPFYSERPLIQEKGSEWSVLWPLLDGYRGESVKQVGFRPLFNLRREFREGREGHVNEIQALWPLVLYRETEGPKQKVLRFFPLFSHRDYLHPDGRQETDTAFFPFLLSGRSSDRGENYFALFPLAGSVRGLFGKDQIRFLLFPLYADSTEGEHRSWHVLWPFFRYSSGGGKSSFRFWPVVGRKQKEGWYDKTFVLWPFFARVRERLGSEHPLDSWFFLPFYGRQQTAFGKIQYFLYPFFSYQRSERPGNRFQEWNGPWPFFRIARGDRYRKTYLWPFWGTEQRGGDYSRQFIAYPIYSYSGYRSPGRVNERRYLLPFFWSWSLKDEQAQREEHFTKLWPLASWSGSKRGEQAVSLLSPLWFRDPDGFERNYGPLWTLYRYRRGALSGAGQHRMLWYAWEESGPVSPDEDARVYRENGGLEFAIPEESGPEEPAGGEDLRDGAWLRNLFQGFPGTAFP